ncbi:MAG: thiamine phosphate synthase, partial [Chloroflexi bacterium]|nr:thiamine phosphate synthase [Chloroflexota bacterium]
MSNLDLSLYVVLDPRLMAGRPLLDVARAALRGGATVLQLRDKEAAAPALVAAAEALAALAQALGARFVINDHVDIAAVVGGAGVHLGPDDQAVAVARALLGPEALIGFSAGTPAEARDAARAGVDYLGTGAVYATSSKADAGAPIGVDGLERVVRATGVPVVAIGGVTLGRAAPCIRAGAAGVAVLRAVGVAADPGRAVAALNARITGDRGDNGVL